MVLQMTPDSLLISGIIIAILALFRRIHQRCITRVHPPGPTGLPFLGNMFDIPYQQAWDVYRQWSRQYGKNGVLSGCDYVPRYNTASMSF